ncbi:hypothetical protein PanWU01x14_331080 [Parasponia andersonii]|uniref:Uncharacterized protein n=1 Tax=Parasponia andersonii TaxID=3476 RepID=A0A2P5AHQ6_PARAD|nr:hypothetical protein PanWU01x14_331080 [Parasponia andersonii]
MTVLSFHPLGTGKAKHQPAGDTREFTWWRKMDWVDTWVVRIGVGPVGKDLLVLL